MRALLVLRTGLQSSLQSMHARRREALWRGVRALLGEGQLWLTGLGRALPGRTSEKHRIKAADRLLGNRALHGELKLVYGALAGWLLRSTRRPVIAIDWTGVGARHCALRASVCGLGRAPAIYTRVYPKKRMNNPAAQRRFLQELATVVPIDSRPIVLTDAGFYPDWFEQVRGLGWDFVGRVRNRTKAQVAGHWVPVRSLYGRAHGAPMDLGTVSLRRERPRSVRLVLSPRPVSKGRIRKTRSGKKGRRTVDRRCAQQAREPWLLATSLSCRSGQVVKLYGLRMQIEQTIRDDKNPRHGWALQHVGSRTCHRIEVLMLLAALATAALHAIGRAAAHAGLERHYQANTVRDRRVLSDFTLARRVLRSRAVLPLAALQAAFDEIAHLLARNAIGVDS